MCLFQGSLIACCQPYAVIKIFILLLASSFGNDLPTFPALRSLYWVMMEAAFWFDFLFSWYISRDPPALVQLSWISRGFLRVSAFYLITLPSKNHWKDFYFCSEVFYMTVMLPIFFFFSIELSDRWTILSCSPEPHSIPNRSEGWLCANSALPPSVQNSERDIVHFNAVWIPDLNASAKEKYRESTAEMQLLLKCV